jgi:oligosaccharyltransferase complex subunit alpha (ribophorin I)
LQVVLPTSNVKSYTDTEKPVAKSDNKLKFGKYDLVKPWTVKPLYLHYEHNKPFKKVRLYLCCMGCAYKGYSM